MLLLFEYRGARLLIVEQFPGTAGSIVSFRVDSDIISLDGKEPLQTDAEVREDGKLHVNVRKSTSSRSDIFSRQSQGPNSGVSLTSRPSNLTNVEIYSLQSSRNPTPRGSSFNNTDVFSMVNGIMSILNLRRCSCKNHRRVKDQSPGSLWILMALVSFDLVYLSGRNMNNVSPRLSNLGNLNFDEEGASGGVTGNMKVDGAYPIPANAGIFSPVAKKRTENRHDLHMFVWSSSASPVSEGGIHVFRGGADCGNGHSGGGGGGVAHQGGLNFKDCTLLLFSHLY